MRLTVGDLKKRIKDFPDDTPVYIERVEDYYFEEGDWKTEHIVFRQDEKGVPIDETEIIKASCSGYTKKPQRIIIYAHI